MADDDTVTPKPVLAVPTATPSASGMSGAPGASEAVASSVTPTTGSGSARAARDKRVDEIVQRYVDEGNPEAAERIRAKLAPDREGAS